MAHGRRPVPGTALAAALALGLVAAPAPAGPVDPAPTAAAAEIVAPGVTHRTLEDVSAERPVAGDLLTVDLAHPGVDVDLVTAGAVAARRPVSEMADRAGAVAAVNGDFFDIGGTGAPVGPAIAGGAGLKAGVPLGQRPGGPPDLHPGDVLGVGADGRARLDRVRLEGSVTTARGTLPLAGLNQHAVPEGGVGAFTSAWGAADRRRSTCGTDAGDDAACSRDTVEVVVTGTEVTAVRDTPGRGPIGPDQLVLVGRDAGAAALRDATRGPTPVIVGHRLVAEGTEGTAGAPLTAAVGAAPILRDGNPAAGLDDARADPRTAAGLSADGTRLYLLTVDGRSAASEGLTLRELAELLRDLGADDGANLDGGGSSTLVTRGPAPGARAEVRNAPSDGRERPVPNALSVFARTRGRP
jgi:hypothetical protein